MLLGSNWRAPHSQGAENQAFRSYVLCFLGVQTASGQVAGSPSFTSPPAVRGLHGAAHVNLASCNDPSSGR